MCFFFLILDEKLNKIICPANKMTVNHQKKNLFLLIWWLNLGVIYNILFGISVISYEVFGDNEALQDFYLFQSLWIEKTLMTTEYTFPGKLRWFEIKSVQSVSYNDFLCGVVLFCFYFYLFLLCSGIFVLSIYIVRHWRKVKIKQKIFFWIMKFLCGQ